VTRIALLGLGHIGRIQVAALSQTEGLDLVAGCDQDASLVTVLPDGVPFYSSHANLLAAGNFDTVIVATPNRTHNALAMDVLSAGYNVIVEKPAASCLDELDRLEGLATERGLHVNYAFHAASAHEVDALVEHLAGEGERYGPITAFTCRFYDPYFDAKGILAGHAHSLDDCWTDSGVNALSVLDRFLPLETLRSVFRRCSTNLYPEPKVLSTSVGFEFPILGKDQSGFGLIDTAWDQGRDHKATTLYFGQVGVRIEANHSEQSLIFFDQQGESTVLFESKGNRLLNHYCALLTDYKDRVQGHHLSMNTDASRRIHLKLFEGMKPRDFSDNKNEK
jgi:predicted dehydrogenase